MKNQHATWRIDFARRLTKDFRHFKGIRAVVIAGSVARSFADEYSDIEIPIFWEVLPDDATRRAIVSELGGEFLFDYNGPAREDQILVQGCQIDLWHITVTHQDSILNNVLHDHQFDPGTLNALDTLRYCIPLYGHELVQNWKRRAQEYPKELAGRIIQEHLDCFSTGQLFLAAQRKNPTAFYGELSHLQQEIFLVLLALNRHYFPTYKWLYPVLESLQIKPDSIARRFQQAFEVPYAEAIKGTKSLLEETVQFVKNQFPFLVTAPVLRHLAYVRAAQEGPVE